MTRIFIDTTELRDMARGLNADAAEMGGIALALTGAWARTPPPPLQLVALGIRGGWTLPRLAGIATQLAAVGVSLHAEAVATELGEIDPRLYDLMTKGGRPFAEGILGFLDGKLSGEWLELLGLAMGGAAGAFYSFAGDAIEGFEYALDSGKAIKDLGGLGGKVGSIVPKITALGKFLGIVGVGLNLFDAVAGWDNIWKREKTDRSAEIEILQDGAYVIGSGMMAIGGAVMLLPVPGVAQAIGGLMMVVGGGLKYAPALVDGAFYLGERAGEAWNNTRAAWSTTTKFVGDAADGAIRGTTQAIGNIAGAGKKMLGLLPP
ncbi:MAG: hypothetical protein EXQ69_03295 [Acidimicrobiia bacterium]|nr:hypothetical protein [Acidimicrobiia bacterium]